MPTVLKVERASPHYIRVPMEDGGRCVVVHIAVSWLQEIAKRDRCQTRHPLLLFNFYRDEIEAAASAKYDRSHCDSADVVLVASDIF